MSVCLSLFLSVAARHSLFQSVSLSLSLSLFLFQSICFCLSICLSVSLSVSFSLSVRQSLRFFSVCFCSSVCLSLCFSFCLSSLSPFPAWSVFCCCFENASMPFEVTQCGSRGVKIQELTNPACSLYCVLFRSGYPRGIHFCVSTFIFVQ